MAVKVLIERHVKAGYEELVWEMLRELRGEAVRQKGYLYGETWRSLDNPRVFLVTSTWGRREYWDTWVEDDFRRNTEVRISAFLRKPGTIRVFEESPTLPTAEAARNNGRRKQPQR